MNVSRDEARDALAAVRDVESRTRRSIGLAGGALAFAISRNRRTSGRVEAVAPEDSI